MADIDPLQPVGTVAPLAEVIASGLGSHRSNAGLTFSFAVLAFLGARGLAGLVYGLDPYDPTAWSAGVLALAVVTLGSATAAAYSATRIDPVRTLSGG